MDTIIGILVFVGLLWLYFRRPIKASREAAQREQQEERIRKVRLLRDTFPDAYKEWFGNSFYFSSMTDSEIDLRLSKNLSEWQSKQKSIEDQREHERLARERKNEQERLENERKEHRRIQALAICHKYPSAIRKRYGFTMSYSEEDVEKVLNTPVNELQFEEAEIQETIQRRKQELDEKYNDIISKYPNGLRIYREKNPSVKSKTSIVSIPHEILKEYEEQYSIGQFYVKWCEDQSVFANEVRNLRNAKLNEWGCYWYNAPVNGYDELGVVKSYNFKIWQFFCEPFCASQDANYTYYPHFKTHFERIPDFQNRKRHFVNGVYDKIVDFILAIPGKPLVNFMDSGMGDIWAEIEDYHFGYFKQRLQKLNIPFVSLDKLPANLTLHKGPVIFVELISNNKRLCERCSHFLQTSSGDKLTVVYISLLKEFDEDEFVSINRQKETEIREKEEKEKIEAERLAREEKEREAERMDNMRVMEEVKQMLSSYPDAILEKFGSVSKETLTLETAKRIRYFKFLMQKNQKRFDDEKAQTQRIKYATRDWDNIAGIPHYFFYWYYPIRFTGISFESQSVRSLIYNFKDGKAHSGVADLIQRKLRSTFLEDDIHSFTFVCIPASTRNVNEARYSSFSKDVCEKLGMRNGFPHVHITKERTAAHLGGTDTAEYSFDESFFKGAKVILFDDIVTRGGSMKHFKSYMENNGATVICSLSVGRTYSDYYGDNRKPHPWTGTL